jgi:hypothetical protein
MNNNNTNTSEILGNLVDVLNNWGEEKVATASDAVSVSANLVWNVALNISEGDCNAARVIAFGRLAEYFDSYERRLDSAN